MAHEILTGGALESAQIITADSFDIVSGANWGEGDGLNGEVLQPESLDSLSEILDRVEFEASVDSTSYVLSSSLRSRVYAFDDDGNRLFELENSSHASAGPAPFSGGEFNPFSISADIITTADEYTEGSDVIRSDIEYSEALKRPWIQKNIYRNIAHASNETKDSIFLFIRPEGIEHRGVLSENEQFNRHVSNDYATLSESAPITIEINSSLASEIQKTVQDSEISFDQYKIQSFSTDFGDSGNITLKLSEYLDDSGKFNIDKLNSDNRFTLEISSDFAEKIHKTDEMWNHVRLRSDPTNPDGNTAHLNLFTGDHDSRSINITEKVESSDNGTSIIELNISPSEINISDYNFTDQNQSITFYLDSISSSLDSLGGSNSEYLNSNIAQSLAGSIQSITLDFNGIDLEETIDHLELGISPTTNLIDLKSFDLEKEYVDFITEGADHASYNLYYEIYNSDLNHPGGAIGNINLSGHYTDDGDIYRTVNGNYHGPSGMPSEASTRLSAIDVYAAKAGTNESGSVRLQFNHDRVHDSYTLKEIRGWGWGEEYSTDIGSGILPSFVQLDWEQFADLQFSNIESGLIGATYSDINAYVNNESLAFTYSLSTDFDNKALSQNAVLGDSVVHSSKYNLDIFAESLENDFRLESTDFTINFNPLLFENISASDIRIDGVMPVSNAVAIDNEAGTIRIAAASLSDLAGYDSKTGKTDPDLGDGIGSNSQKLATISLDFSESQIKDLDKNPDGSLMISPLAFNIQANLDETTFSKDFYDGDGQLNREILSLDDLGGGVTVDGQEVTLYEAKINFEQLEDGLVIGTDRVIGADASFTNLVRTGDLLTTTSNWLNVGNIQANNLIYSELYNQNASLENATFSQTSVASGSFIDGVFVKDARESTTLTTDIRITGDAGNVVDLSDGIVSIKAEGSESFTNIGKGSSNLITFQGDLNYDGRVSMKDLAYLNAGAARQQLVESTDENGNDVQIASEASYARDVDADFSGKIDLADLSVLDADWGKTLHTGDEQFQGSADVSWSELDSQGSSSTWDNDSFKDQNETEAAADYIGSLESPATTNVIGADGNTSANDGDSTQTYFQETV